MSLLRTHLPELKVEAPADWPTLRKHGLEPLLAGAGPVTFEAGLIHPEVHDALDDRWYFVARRAIRWVDGRSVELHLEELEVGAHLTAAGELLVVVDRLRLPVEDVATRRFKHDARGHRVDMRATLRAGLRDPDIIPLQFKSRRRRRKRMRPA